MSAGVELVEAMKKVRESSAVQNDLVYGIVISVSPIRIRLEDNRELPEKMVVLSRFCREKRSENAEGHSHLLWRGLNIGDKVVMISLNRGQKYYIAERVGDW